MWWRVKRIMQPNNVYYVNLTGAGPSPNIKTNRKQVNIFHMRTLPALLAGCIQSIYREVIAVVVCNYTISHLDFEQPVFAAHLCHQLLRPIKQLTFDSTVFSVLEKISSGMEIHVKTEQLRHHL